MAAAGGNGGVVATFPAELMDVGATLVSVAGGELRHEQFARSLLPTVTQPALPHRPEGALSEYCNYCKFRLKWPLFQ